MPIIWDDLEDADGYEITAKSSAMVQTYSTNLNKFVVKNLYPATEYTIAVKGVNKNGSGKDTEIVLITGM